MTGALVRSLLGALTRFSREERGASAMVVAIVLPGLIGFGALGAETGLWYTIKLRNQSAADAAAISAAYEVIAGKTSITSDLTPAASEAATQNAYTGTTPAVVQPYSDGIVSNGVAVTLQQTQGAFLASPFLPGVTVISKAVAVIKVLDNPCILARATNGTGVQVASSSSLNVPNCSVAANSTSASAIDLQDGTSSIAATTLVTRGEISFAGNPIDPAAPPSEFILSSRPMIGAPAITDPYSGILTDIFDTTRMPSSPNCTLAGSTWSGSCVITGSALMSGSPITLTGNTQITGGWHIINQTVDLKPGTYWITNGDLTLDTGAAVTCSTCAGGTGVTIILTKTGTATVGGLCSVSNSSVTLSAPTTGRYAAYLIIQDPRATSGTSSCENADNSFQGGANMNLTGLLYFPNTTVSFRGNPSATCTVLIANRVVIDGNSSLTASRCRRAGLTKLPTVNTVALGE